jgi:hypothetical protein
MMEREFGASKLIMGLYATYEEYLQSPQWDVVKEAYLLSYCERCGVKKERCPWCGWYTNPILQLHHKDYSDVGNEDGTMVITLCKKCHSEEHGIEYVSPPPMHHHAKWCLRWNRFTQEQLEMRKEYRRLKGLRSK